MIRMVIGLLLSFTGSFMQNAALLWNVSLLVRCQPVAATMMITPRM